MLLRAWANFSDCGFFKEGFSVLGRSFPFPSLKGFFPSFCQALAEDRVTTPTKKKKNMWRVTEAPWRVLQRCLCCSFAAFSWFWGLVSSQYLISTRWMSRWCLLRSLGHQYICQLLYHGFFILICPNILCAMSVDSACVRILWKLRQRRGLMMVLAYVTNNLVKMNTFRTRCMLFYFAKTIEFVSWGNIFVLSTPFLRTFQQPHPFCCKRSTTNLFMISFLCRTIDFFFFYLSLWIYLWLADTSQQPISHTTWLKVTPIVTIIDQRSEVLPVGGTVQVWLTCQASGTKEPHCMLTLDRV